MVTKNKYSSEIVGKIPTMLIKQSITILPLLELFVNKCIMLKPTVSINYYFAFYRLLYKSYLSLFFNHFYGDISFNSMEFSLNYFLFIW